MSAGAPAPTQIPPIETLATDILATLSLAAQAYLGDDATPAGDADLGSAEVAIDLASSTFERIKERLKPEERMAVASMLTDVRMAYVRRKGL